MHFGPQLLPQEDMVTEPHGTSRRSFLLSLIGTGVVPSMAGLAVARTQEPPIRLPTAPFSRAFEFSKLNSWITPNNDFFVRSHFGVPTAEVAAWTVTVGGAVERERVFAIDALLRMPKREAAVTLECAGNLVGWGGVSNARWAGVRLGALIEAAGALPGATEVVLVGSDGGAEREAGGIKIDAYARSIPLAKAMDSDTILAFRMNDEPVPDLHGGPVRAIVPGWYAMDSVKWLKRILVSREQFNGWHQLNRYYEARLVGGRTERRPLGPVRIKSQIARPLRNEVLRVGRVTVAGAAWCGDADIARVGLSFDGGRSWREATFGEEHESRAWRLWSYQWSAAARGSYEIVARARDSLGRAQPLDRDPTILTPYANNWCDRRIVEVR